MKYLVIIKCFFRFLKTGVLSEYESFLMKSKNSSITFGKGFKCTNPDRIILGKGSVLGNNVLINCGNEEWSENDGIFKCGKNCYIGPNSVVFAAGNVELSDDVLISPSVNIISHQHIYDKKKPYSSEKSSYKKITIEKNVWIGSNATILPGISIGRNSIVAANAVITKDVQANVIVGGVPAKIIKRL